MISIMRITNENTRKVAQITRTDNTMLTRLNAAIAAERSVLSEVDLRRMYIRRPYRNIHPEIRSIVIAMTIKLSSRTMA